METPGTRSDRRGYARGGPCYPALAVESIQPATAILSRILAQLQRGQIQIPAVPGVVMELRELVGKSGTKIEAIVALIERDPALVARVLQLGRSAAFGRAGQTADLPYIINRVGFRQLSNVIEVVWAHDCFKVADARYEPYVARLTRQAVARAAAARVLADQQRIEPFPAYLASLFADVGASFLLWAIVDKSRGHVPAPEAALQFVREHHETMGGAVLKRWGHAELVVGLVRHHHAPAGTGAAASQTSEQVRAVQVIAAQMAFELTGEEDLTAHEHWPDAASLQRCTEQLPLEEDVRSRLMSRAQDEYRAALDVFF
jgi:HD-like signal output (HDOD) protein